LNRSSILSDADGMLVSLIRLCQSLFPVISSAISLLFEVAGDFINEDFFWILFIVDELYMIS